MFSKKSTEKKGRSAIKNIVTINPYTDRYYIYKDSVFRPANKLTYNTSNFNVSYIGNKDIITSTVHVSRSIPEEDIADVLDIKAYEELGLDQASDYIISYYEVETDAEEREFHIFVAEPERLEELFLPIKEQTKYIDLIVPAPLLYKTLYKKEILQDTGVDCFIYFTRYDAFIAIYQNGEFVYAKSIDFSLEQIYDKYCELIGEKVDEKEFFTVLEGEGLKTTRGDYQQSLMKIFGEVFITINDVIIYVKRAYKLESIDHLYIGSVNGPIIGLDEYSQNYLGLNSSDLNFDYHIQTDEWYTDQLQYMMLLAGLEYMEDEEFFVNLTMFPRPPAFLNRPGGQFIVAVVAATSIGLAYPLFFLVSAYINDAKTYALKYQDDKLKAEANRYKSLLGQKKKEIEKLDKELSGLNKIYHAKTQTLKSIYDKKVHYRLKSGIYHELAEELSKYGVHVDRIVTKGDTIQLSIVSQDDRRITQLIQNISDKYFDQIQRIDIEEIAKEPESMFYRGVLKVVLR